MKNVTDVSVPDSGNAATPPPQTFADVIGKDATDFVQGIADRFTRAAASSRRTSTAAAIASALAEQCNLNQADEKAVFAFAEKCATIAAAIDSAVDATFEFSPRA